MGGLHPPKTPLPAGGMPPLLLRKLRNKLFNTYNKMEIPNYDSTNDPDKKYKQLYPFMPSDTFRMLICGNSGSGKTNLLYHMLIKPLLYYDEIYL